MELTRQADYAIRCVLETARQGRISARVLAERQALSPSFVGKIVSSLARVGILETRRGAAGGVELGRPASAISVLEVVEAVQGPIRLNRCVRTPPACSLVSQCPVAPLFQEAQDALSSAFSVSFAELLSRDAALRDGDDDIAADRVAPRPDATGGHGMRRVQRLMGPASPSARRCPPGTSRATSPTTGGGRADSVRDAAADAARGGCAFPQLTKFLGD
jgi:Rrf2 family protein